MTRASLLIVAFAAMLTGCGEAPGGQTDVAAGQAIFEKHCAACHGPGGDVRRAEQHDAETPDLRRIAANSAGGRLPRVILAEIIDGRRIVQAHGKGRTMPVWGENEEIDAVGAEALVDYISTIQTR